MRSIKDTMNYMVHGIKYACFNFKNRSAGSTSEKKCQRHFKQELSKWADQVDEETFSLHPKAFMGWLPIAGLMNIFAVELFWIRLQTDSVIVSILGVLAVLLATILVSMEFLLYREFIDFLFPKAVSRNIMARRAPKGEVKRRIIFGGHADAAYEMTYSFLGKRKIVFLVTVGATIGMLFVLISSVALLIQSIIASNIDNDGFYRIIGLIGFAFVPFFIAILFFINWDRVVDGANDNLSGCFVAMGVLKEMAEKNFRFEHTEVCCLITGAEESGLRGSLAYAKRHMKELFNVETVFIALDTLREIEHLQVYTQGQIGVQKNSEAVGKLLDEAGKNCGIKMPRAKPYPGATDAEGFSRNGILSCGFCGVNHDPQPYYHTRHDTWNNISKACLRISLKVCMEASHLYDKYGGILKYEGRTGGN